MNETEQLRAELERVKTELKQRNDDCKNLMETARYAEAQLDAANRREAKLREVVSDTLACALYPDWLFDKLRAALQPDAGKEQP